MGTDEKVDGPRVAARILNSMPAERKQRLLAQIRGSAPQICHAIETNIIDFEDIKDLVDQGIQRLILEVDHRDLVLALKKASREVSQALLRNMSERKRQVVVEDLKALPPTPVADVDAAHKRIVAVMERLRTEGAIHRRDDDGERRV